MLPSLGSRARLFVLTVIMFCFGPHSAFTQGPPQSSPTQSSTLNPQSERPTLGPDLPLDSVPKRTLSVRFVVSHRSALNGRAVRVRGVVAAAFLGAAACPPDRGMCMPSSIILGDPDRGKNRLASSLRVLMPPGTKPGDYPLGKILQVRAVASGDKTSISLRTVD